MEWNNQENNRVWRKLKAWRQGRKFDSQPPREYVFDLIEMIYSYSDAGDAHADLLLVTCKEGKLSGE